MESKTYKLRVVRGAFLDPRILDDLKAVTIEKLDRDEWQSIDTLKASLTQIRNLQKQMVRHYDDPTPWYMDGYSVMDKDDLIVAFGADDGEGGKIFLVRRTDTKAIDEVIRYGIQKGIPKEQMDFLEIGF